MPGEILMPASHPQGGRTLHILMYWVWGTMAFCISSPGDSKVQRSLQATGLTQELIPTQTSDSSLCLVFAVTSILKSKFSKSYLPFKSQ